MLKLVIRDDHVLLPVKVVPGASKTRCMGVLDDRLKIAVAAPPEKGKANAQLIAFLAKKLSLRKKDITVERGHSSPLKLVRINDTTEQQLRKALAIMA